MSNSLPCCRACGGREGVLVLDLGVQPLANNLLRSDDLEKTEPKFPLRVFVCTQCWLLQLAELVPPVALFTEYLYFSSFSDAMLCHAQTAAERYMQEFALQHSSLVVEVASNDGYLLQNFVKAGVPCLGVEPAANIAEVAERKGVETLVAFFGEAVARDLAGKGQQADLILGNNVFAHAPEINDFIAGLAILLKPEGRVVLEFPYAVDFLNHTEFDTIYHEHVFYFALSPLVPLFQRHGLEVFRVERLAIHGGSLRIFVGHHGCHAVEASVPTMLADEEALGISGLELYRSFAQAVERVRHELTEFCADKKRAGHSLAAYGASAKGSTLLNYCGIGSETLSFVADRSTYKQGRLTPGTHLPIVAVEELATRKPDYTLLLTWNFAEEILAQQHSYREAGGRFVLPLPHLVVV